MKKTIFGAAMLSLLMLAVSCQTIKLPASSKYTAEYTRREGQVAWFSEEELTTTIRIIASCISGSEMTTDYLRARDKYAECLRVCYANLSENGKDVDAGVRGLNLIHKLHKEADGSSAFWTAVVKQAKNAEDPNIQGMPIPADY